MRGCGNVISVKRFGICIACLLAALFFIGSAQAASGINTWSALQDAIDRAGDGETITLSEDLTALETDTEIIVWEGKRITLDLNGHLLDSSMKPGQDEQMKSGQDGHRRCVINIRAGAILTLLDSGGTGVLTGGFHDNGAGIQNNGTLIMEGGCVTGNTALHYGGGIANYGTMVLTGGSVIGNTASLDSSQVFNGAKGHMTVGGDAAIGNGEAKRGGIRNAGTLTVIDAQAGEVRMEDMPVLTRSMDHLSILPVATLLVALLLIVWLDAYLSRERKRLMVMIIALVFLLLFQNYWDNRMSLAAAYNTLRVPLSVLGYALRPLILVMFLYIVKPKGHYKAAWALSGVNAAVYMTAFFSDVAFHFSSNGHFKSGPLHHTCTVISAVLYAWLFLLTMQQFRPHARRESWILILVTVLIGGATAMDFTVAYNDQPISFLTMSIAISCIFYYIWLHLQFVREHEEALRTGQRIQIMMSQIRPHFLFNSLEVIRRIYRKDPEKADDALLKFERYLRGNMDFMAQEERIPFRTELEHTQTYLELERLRFPNELNIDYDLCCMDFLLPSLTLQPLAENAVRHGIRGKKSGEGTVTIATREYENRYEVIVMDDGNGFDPDVSLQDTQSHIGLSNVRERLRYAGDELRIGAGPEGGTKAVIIIPKR